jgi:hypothetical protein
MPPVFNFDEPTHTYTLDGVRMPSVTQVLRPLYSFDGIPLAVLNAKAALGTAVHKACELLDKDDLDEESEEGRTALAPLAGYLTAYKNFKRNKRLVILANEKRLFHPVHKYAGQIDRSYAMDGCVWDVDLKSTVSISPIVALQTAAYSEMLRANGRGDVRAKRGALQLFPDGKYRLHEFSAPQDFSLFLTALNFQRIKERIAP